MHSFFLYNKGVTIEFQVTNNVTNPGTAIRFGFFPYEYDGGFNNVNAFLQPVSAGLTTIQWTNWSVLRRVGETFQIRLTAIGPGFLSSENINVTSNTTGATVDNTGTSSTRDFTLPTSNGVIAVTLTGDYI
jgi:hypothetical protein